MNLNPIAAKHGAAVGAVQVALTLVVYIAKTELLFNPWFSLSTWVLVFVAMYLGLKGVRESEGGVLRFARAWGHAYAVAMAMTAIVMAFAIVLYGVIDPGLVELAVKSSMSQIEEVTTMLGGNSSDFEAAFENVEPEIRKQFTPVGILSSGFWSLVVYLIPTLIMALVMRRSESIDPVV